MKITYIALLRGINVSGQKQIKLNDLKSMFEAMKFTDVQTYIQSGNVVFKSKQLPINKLEKRITKAISDKYGFDVKVIVKTPEEIEYVLNNNPFIKKKKNIERLYVTFLSENPSEANITKLKENNYAPEEYIIDDTNIFLFFPNGYGKAKLNNNHFESKLKVHATTRNWKTIQAIAEMSIK